MKQKRARHVRYSKPYYSKTGWKAVTQQLQGVDAMFEVLEKDKQLPSFGEFFIACLIMGNAECVNLKAMFPKLHKDLSAWLVNH